MLGARTTTTTTTTTRMSGHSVFARQYTDDDVRFDSRRSPVYGTRGACSSSQPLATEAGLQVLRRGGNAADACVAACLAEVDLVAALDARGTEPGALWNAQHGR